VNYSITGKQRHHGLKNSGKANPQQAEIFRQATANLQDKGQIAA